jgi:hypothetical protein
MIRYGYYIQIERIHPDDYYMHYIQDYNNNSNDYYIQTMYTNQYDLNILNTHYLHDYHIQN